MSDPISCDLPDCCKGERWPQCQGGREVPAQEAHYDDQQHPRSRCTFTD